ncbi:FAD-dependent oxidoreductase [Acinetobacter sp. MD2(2019)]|uniref:FAD-dependent oxidoreductase n=1 Tax=Acinetobacter sp. MD2(2019) TaxID=2605273 RepID=UPI002D1EC669|nr:FAD-dependent oxidoreductase [Acinetobacter sp. MD2(2019)]MEB3753428.1 FAD-dependent oxidoreductase [Acinetobacter sp. MD2(2019)]
MQPMIIIGSGMAGYTLAREYRKLNKEQPLIMLCADDGASYAKPTLSNALASNKHPTQIALADANKMAEQLNMQIITHAWVTAVDSEQHTLSYTQNQQTFELEFSQLILAVGANPIRLAISGDGSDDIHLINSLTDYRAFREHLDLQQQQRIVILGAGLIGCEFANDLHQAGHAATVIDLAPQPLGRLLPAHVASAFQQKLQQSGVRFILETTVDRVSKIDQHYLITLANGHSIEADAVICAIGLQPNIELAKQTGINTSRGIITNTLMQTNLQHIYALGDCAEVNGTLLPYVMPLMQQARALAKTLAGEHTQVHYPAMPVAVKTPAAPLTVLPPPQNVVVNWETEYLEDGLVSKAIDSENMLRGFVLLGATAAKQRLSLTKLVPDLIPAQV